MDHHNEGLTDSEDIALYLKRDEYKRDPKNKASKSIPYEIVRDEIVGR